MKNARPELMLVLCTIIWGATFPAIKYALQFVTAWQLVAMRFTAAGLIFAIFYRKELLALRAPLALHGLLLGVFLFAGFSLQTLGLETTTSSRSAFLTELLVVFTPLFHFLLSRQLPSWRTAMGVLVVMSGMYLLISPEGTLAPNTGDFLTLGCALAFSAYILAVDRWSTASSRGPLAALQCLTVAALAITNTTQLSFTTLPPLLWGILAFLVLPGTVVVVLLQLRYQPLTTPTRAGIIFALEPVFAMLYAVLLCLEDLQLRNVVGAAVVTFGVVWTEMGQPHAR